MSDNSYGLSRNVTDFSSLVSRVFDRCPNEVDVIHAFLNDRLVNASKANICNPTDDALFVSRVFADLYRDALNSKECMAAGENMLHEYSRLPSTKVTKISSKPGENSITGAIFIGFAIGTLVVMVTIGYLSSKSDSGSDDNGDTKDEPEQ